MARALSYPLSRRLSYAPGNALLGGIPAWVLAGASVDLDFANGRYYGGTLASLLSVSRSSSKTNLLPSSASGFAYSAFLSNILAVTPGSGALIEEARTNLFLNSTVPVTQTITLPATGSYTLWVNGSGSAAIAAGTATITGAGTATNGTPIIINCTVAGTVVVTVTGSLNAAQLEAGAFGTSLIVTGGASATRPTDNVTLAGNAQTAITGAAFAAIYQGIIPNIPTGSGTLILSDNSSPFDTMLYATAGITWSSFAVAGGGLTDGGFTANVLQKAAITSDVTGRSVVSNGGTVASDVNKVVPTSTIQLCSVAVVNVGRLTLYNSRLANSTLQARTV